MLSHQTNSDPPQEVEPQNSGLLDLSRQLRNLLLLRPLFQLELNKTRIGEDGASDDGLFQGVDTFYLALSALDFMMEATTISMGAPQGEVQGHLANVACSMKPALSKAQSFRVAPCLRTPVSSCLLKSSRTNSLKNSPARPLLGWRANSQTAKRIALTSC